MGDFSRTPLDVLLSNLKKGYVSLHIEQGVPILDRDLNLLSDLVAATTRAVITRYIGNGLPPGSQGFAIQAIPADNNFRISAGPVASAPAALLVGGMEVTIPADINYVDQTGVPALTTPSVTQPNPREDIVYLDSSLVTVDATTDPDLSNSADIGLQTSVRDKPFWVVRVAEGIPVPNPLPGHTHYPLARLTRTRAVSQIQTAMITDLRQTRLNLAEVETRLSAVERFFLPAFNPSPNQFNPKFGMPGANVTLFGKNFDVGTVTVRFGATTAAIVGTPISTQIVAAVPAMAAGAVQITVQTGSGSVTSVDTFTVLPFPAPVFDTSPNEFNPKFGAAGTNVTLFGNNFNIGATSVRFGLTAAVIVGIPTAARITATVPAMAPGAVKITVQTAGGSIISVDNFTVL